MYPDSFAAEAEKVATEMEKSSALSPDLRIHRYQLAFYKEDRPGMAVQLKWAMQYPNDGYVILNMEADMTCPPF